MDYKDLSNLEYYNNEEDKDLDNKYSHNRGLLLTDPMTAALFATTVNTIFKFSESLGCGTFDPFGERVEILINNHFCNNYLDYGEKLTSDTMEVSPTQTISAGQGNTGGRFYAKTYTNGAIRYYIKIEDTWYNIDIMWCVDCPMAIGRSTVDYDFYGLSVNEYYNWMSLETSYNCLYSKFYQTKNGITSGTTGDCTSTNFKILDVYEPGTSTSNKNGINEGDVGLWFTSQMTEGTVKHITLDVYPYNWGSKRDGMCPA
jgi:hypothetical protein